MRFPDLGTGRSTGWSSYSGDSDAERFQDEGRGTALLVSIEAAGAPPAVETVEIGRLRWCQERRDVTSQPLGEIITHYAEREHRELTLLRLCLTGVIDPQKYPRINEVLKTIVCDRYYPGSCLEADDVLVEAHPEQLSRLVGDGVLSRVLERLRDESRSADPATKHVADHALKLLYRIASEGQAS
jgi:hypothetical protein